MLVVNIVWVRISRCVCAFPYSAESFLPPYCNLAHHVRYAVVVEQVAGKCAHVKHVGVLVFFQFLEENLSRNKFSKPVGVNALVLLFGISLKNVRTASEELCNQSVFREFIQFCVLYQGTDPYLYFLSLLVEHLSGKPEIAELVADSAKPLEIF